ncbi:MAG: glycine--tRNA ligase subunit beta [Paracoccaceae bacterium]
MKELLIELLSEEIPSRMQEAGRVNLRSIITKGLIDAGLTYESATPYSTPRRLVLVVSGLSDKSAPFTIERKGPRVTAPDQAINGFLKSTGLNKRDLEVRSVKGTDFYFANIKQPGRDAANIVSEVLSSSIKSFPWPKSMRWGTNMLRWVRPLNNILCLLSDENQSETVNCDLGFICSNNKSFGHRLVNNKEFSVGNFNDFKKQLKKSRVILDHEERKREIYNASCNLAFALGLDLVDDPLLLDEVTNLVEWPHALVGKISSEFLTLPSEVLQVSMRKHQKFFSLKNKKTNLIEGFITVSNNQAEDNGKLILDGNQRVLFARLSDAKFFWENDLRTISSGMESWVNRLRNVTYHNKLGSQFERVERIRRKSLKLAQHLTVDENLADQASLYSKADLSSEMVNEFPELQGLMGSYYAQACDFSPEVALAIKDHYSPLGPNDDCPKSLISIVVALSDKLDTLESFWRIDQKPTGSSDPFALRRAALGVIRLILENNISIDIDHYIFDLEDDKLENLVSFFHERLKVFLKEKNIRYDIIDACLSSKDKSNIFNLFLRVKALSDRIELKETENLIQGFKRVNNILKKAENIDGVVYELEPDIKFFEVPEEHKLFTDLNKINEIVIVKLSQNNFLDALESLVELSNSIDNFFTAVKVNSDNSIVRRNRLCLLQKIRVICNEVADFSLLEG